MGLGSEPSRCESGPVGSGWEDRRQKWRGVFSRTKEAVCTPETMGKPGHQIEEPGGFSDCSLGMVDDKVITKVKQEEFSSCSTIGFQALWKPNEVGKIPEVHAPHPLGPSSSVFSSI